MTLHLALVILSWVATVLQLTGVWLNGRKNILCWPFWIVGTALWMVFAVGEGVWSIFVLNATFNVLNVLGWRAWAKERRSP